MLHKLMQTETKHKSCNNNSVVIQRLDHFPSNLRED